MSNLTRTGGLASWSIKRPIAVIMLSLSVLVVGLFSLDRLNINLLPDITYPDVHIRILETGTTGKDYLGIGLDMFLGSDYKAYAQLGLPQYKSMLMSEEYLVPSVLLGWVSTEFEMPIAQPNLLEEMIHQGKLIYMLDALIPMEKDAKKINYTQEQYDWCENNKKEIWFYFMDNELLYTKENSQIIKFMGEAPFTQGFPEGSPGRIGHYLGWQIVKAYMKKNPEVTIPELMQEEDFQKILTKSKYKP